MSNRRAELKNPYKSTSQQLFKGDLLLPDGRFVLIGCCAANSWPSVGGCAVARVIEDYFSLKKE
ncbi:hypothetical protein I5S84_17145 [Pseudomonas putida]|uniref:Uncharacterized protein n=1 Tax=Pseudomonas putida TaxID=303 RepID=A0ABD7B909_PSEPU|nr:hypothetical protein [Pseudomonas putida]MBH3450582.1 hypothetical protein [Pseudomonas putida]QOC95959.1 hypothetical protein ID616_17795 [Pseudomonas putida]